MYHARAVQNSRLFARHFAAFLMLAQDVNPKVMQEGPGPQQFRCDDGLIQPLMPAATKDVATRMDALLTGTD